jgi:tripartite-type tricarboxylate transporter receptor subunit TctC
MNAPTVKGPGKVRIYRVWAFALRLYLIIPPLGRISTTSGAKEGKMKILHWALVHAAGAVLAMVAAVSASAQNYPNRPITIVLPFAAGGGGDMLARIVSAKLEQQLGRPVLVEPKPGAGGVIASNVVAKGTADGYTLLMGTSSPLAINVTLYKSLPYNPGTDFIPVIDMARVPFVLVVNPSLPVKTVRELIQFAKENPDKLSFGSSGVGSPGHLFMEMFKSMTGTSMIHVPYKGTLPALSDVVAGHIQLMFCDVGPCRGQLESGAVRPLGIATKTRFTTVPNIPTIAESGVPGYEAAAWQMLVAPAKTPREIVDKLHAELKSILDQQEVKDQIIQNGFIPVDNPSVDELHAFVNAEIMRWGKVVTQTGLAGSQ